MSNQAEKVGTSAARNLLNEVLRCGAIPLDTATCADTEGDRANDELREQVEKRGGFPVKGAGTARDDEYCKEKS